MAAGDPGCQVFGPEFYNNTLPTQIPQIETSGQEYIRLTDPYSGLVGSGTFPANQGELLRKIVVSPPALQQSQVRPEKQPWIGQGCGLCGPIALPGNTEFQTFPQVTPGRSQFLCLSDTYAKVMSTLSSYVKTMKAGVAEMVRNDTRIQLHDLSGTKFVARQNTSFDSLVTGGLNQVGVQYNFAGGLPNAPMSFKALFELRRYLVEDLRQIELYDNETVRVIVGTQQLEYIRNNGGLNTDQRDATKGSFARVKDARWQPFWDNVWYRGFSFARDEQPLRFNVVNDDGTPSFIPPQILDNTSYGVLPTVNPDWQNALYEVGVMATDNGFLKVIPNRGYTGEGEARFAPQFYGGEMQWINNKDNQFNPTGNLGYFYYQYIRGFLPERPHGIAWFAYQRCQSDLNLIGCDNSQS